MLVLLVSEFNCDVGRSSKLLFSRGLVMSEVHLAQGLVCLGLYSLKY